MGAPASAGPARNSSRRQEARRKRRGEGRRRPELREEAAGAISGEDAGVLLVSSGLERRSDSWIEERRER